MKWIIVLLLSLSSTWISSQPSLSLNMLSSEQVVVTVNNQESPQQGWGHTYQWDLRHIESGVTWTYHGNVPYKTLNMPWYGTYTLRARLRDVHITTQAAYGWTDLHITFQKVQQNVGNHDRDMDEARLRSQGFIPDGTNQNYRYRGRRSHYGRTRY